MQLLFNALPQGQYLITFTFAVPYHTIRNRLHRLRAAAPPYFYLEVGSRSHFNWQKCLFITASVATDST